MTQNHLRVILPCAGFGRRMGLGKISKELLIDHASNCKLIDQALKHTSTWNPLVVVREQKKDLITHLQEFWPEVELFIVEETKEWPDSLLRCQSRWFENNVVVLPDTRFEPLDILPQMFAGLAAEAADVVFATFPVVDPSTWGVVQIDVNKNEISGCEKPEHGRNLEAWGLFGFKKSVGAMLLSELLQSTLTHRWYNLSLIAKIYRLDDFEDLTRPSLVTSKKGSQVNTTHNVTVRQNM